MTLCPLALAVGCIACAVIAICPLKTVIGDYKPPIAKPVTPPKKPLGT